MTALPSDEGIFMDSQDRKDRAGLSGTEREARRTFLTRVGKATATAPAVALLLAASTKAATAQSPYAPGDTAGDSTCEPEGGSGSGSAPGCSGSS